jgi:hypothetical protein
MIRYLLPFFLVPLAGAEPSVVKIVPRAGGGFELLRNGKPYFIKGAVGSRELDRLVTAGGNSIRIYSPGAALDDAESRGLTALVGLNLGRPRQGFDYRDARKVQAQRDRVREAVAKFKDHPGVLMWALGNENELRASDEDRLLVWKETEQLARIVKETDPNHPVITVIAGLGKANLEELAQTAPSLDAVGINTYGGMLTLGAAVRKHGWKKPWLVTEFGPRGHWEVSKTAWGMPIEDSSTEKADFYERAYQASVTSQPACLGSYVFLWGQKQEKTHTWYGMFLPDGTPLGAVDAMTHAWTGRWPANRAPRIGELRLDGSPEHVFGKGSSIQAHVTASDPDSDPVKITWDLRKDVADNPNTGGDREEPTPPLQTASGADVVFPAPPAAGNYRIFVYVYDGKGSAATANVPVRVRE